MNYKINIKDFSDNELELEIKIFKLLLLYNGKPQKLKRNKIILKDDNNKDREIKIVDHLFKAPTILLDNKEKIEVIPKPSKILYIFSVFSALMLTGGAIGGMFGGINFYLTRNTFISNHTMTAKILFSILITIINFTLLMITGIFISKLFS